METHHRLLGRAGLLSVMTFASRLLGMIRDMVCAAIFGTGYVWDAFIYAFTFPNFLRRVLGEGALSSVFIPVYTETLNKRGKAAADHLANDMITLVLVATSCFVAGVLGLLAVLLKWVPLDARGVLTVKLSMLLFPYILFLSQYGMAMAILNCRGHFFTPSLAPVLFNVIWIASAAWIAPHAAQTDEGQVMFLALCLLAAGLLQFLIQLIPLSRGGFRLRFVFDLKNNAVRRVLSLFLPATMGFGIMQVNILFDRTLAAWLGEGANSSLWYSNRLIQFPIGMIAIAMGTALLPHLSDQITRDSLEEAKQSLSFSLRMVLVLVIPASVGLIAFSAPIVRVLFERGAFDEISTFRSARTLMAYSLGLFAYSGSNLVVSAFYAMKDTKTPVKIASYCVVFDIVANLILMIPLRELGLALTTSMSGILNFGMLIYHLNKKQLKLNEKEIGRTFLKSILASAGSAWMAGRFLAAAGGVSAGDVSGFAKLFAGISVGIASYVIFAQLLKMGEMRELLWFFRKRFYDTRRTD
ncbi:MAG: murein biosynthesis integral membrane protein MurJ [Candidatus Omnitrophica bacterium]|nr:murein biosynthesis integral membrane protein MurJ [Candidatus Omnitrophota bacterium]